MLILLMNCLEKHGNNSFITFMEAEEGFIDG